MSSVVNKEKSKVFETVFSSPGMTQKCKISIVMSRQNILLLSRIIEAALLTDKHAVNDEIVAAVPKESLEEFREIHEEILKKSSLTDFYEKLKSL